ncbi:MAG: 4'-phosphopantetheinyl transferase superfamily protein [Pedobacter sp.]|nr:4'-phosphopantetheinyl transferase superfamily protein [Pedobacter sp.]
MLTEPSWKTFEHEVLNLEEIYIFKLFVPEVTLIVNNLFEEILSKSELVKAEKFRFPKDKELFITGRLVSRLLIEHMLNLSLKCREFDFTKRGKPMYPGLEFNLSHSGKYVLIIISNRSVGIDIEIPETNFDFSTVLEHTFSLEEINYIKKSDYRRECFLTLWTRKEALLKATGEGLIDDLTSISVLDHTIKRMGSNYIINSFKINDTDIASVAIKGAPVKLNTFNILPPFFHACINE